MRTRSQERTTSQQEQENAAQQALDEAIIHTLKPSEGGLEAGFPEYLSDSGLEAEYCPDDGAEEEGVSPRDKPETSPLDEPKTPLSTYPEPDRSS